MKLKSFFGYFGSKHRIAKHYPAPLHDMLIEPFAGSAAYACHYPERKVILVEKDPAVAAVWRYLIATPAKRILELPLIPDAETLVSSLPGINQEERWLIGFNIHSGEARPRDKISNHCRDYRPPWQHHSRTDPKTGWQKPTADTSQPLHEGYENFWGAKRRARIARQVDAIKHWVIVEGDYTSLPNYKATWFVDPPYEKAGKSYRFHDIDRAALGEWCLSRNGQLIVCEAVGATWLPFRELGNFKATPGVKRTGKTAEAIYP